MNRHSPLSNKVYTSAHYYIYRPSDDDPKAPTPIVACATVGGDQERVEIHLNAHPDEDQIEARRHLKEQFATFDAAKAQCFLESDRQHLLAVIEAGFGDFYDFNRVARNLFARRLARNKAVKNWHKAFAVIQTVAPPERPKGRRWLPSSGRNDTI